MAGGCGKYQVMWMSIVLSGMLAGGFLLYSIYLLKHPPNFTCTYADGVVKTCK